MDIKALMSQMYDKTGVQTVFGGNRCYDPDPEVSSRNRYKDYRCRDLTPDFLHLMLTNFIGRFKTSFIVDIDSKGEVWNQPVRGYEVIERIELTGDIAANWVNPDLHTYIYNKKAAKFVFYRIFFQYVSEAIAWDPSSKLNPEQYTKGKYLFLSNGNPDYLGFYYDYILELDGKNNIIGGEWIGESKTQHPDFLWVPLGRLQPGTVGPGGMKYDDIRKLLKKSRSKNC